MTEYRSWTASSRSQHLAAALDFELHGLADAVVEHLREQVEVRRQLAVDAHQDVARLERPSAGAPRCTSDTTSMPVLVGKLAAHGGFGLGAQAEAVHFVERRVDEHGLQRAARDRLAVLDQLQRARDAIERQVEARRAAELPPAFSASTRPSMSMTGEPDEPPDVLDAAW